jgi:hypothetical protein
MTIAKMAAILVLLFLLLYWKHLALAVMGLAEDYELWTKLKSRGVENRSFYRYWLDECW